MVVRTSAEFRCHGGGRLQVHGGLFVPAEALEGAAGHEPWAGVVGGVRHQLSQDVVGAGELCRVEVGAGGESSGVRVVAVVGEEGLQQDEGVQRGALLQQGFFTGSGLFPRS